MQAIRSSDRAIILTRIFPAPGQAVFDALTQSDRLLRWLQPGHMSLVTCEVDLRSGGAFRYVFQRLSGASIEVRGAYTMVEPPRRFAYQETYDFSPLKVGVETALDELGSDTRFTQTLTYPSTQERDEDFDGVAASAIEVYAKLELYLGSSG
jgi:uncharacterized protein YndB with AHSA1/START domain